MTTSISEIKKAKPSALPTKKASRRADPPLVSAAHLGIPRCAANSDEAIAVIREHHAVWQQNQSKSA